MSSNFRAWHVMPDMQGPEGELHSHDYRIEVVVSRPELDEPGMVVDIDVLNDALKRTIARVEDQNLEVIQEGAQAVTVEIFARWAHRGLGARLPNHDATVSVRIWESPVAFGGYSGSLAVSSS